MKPGQAGAIPACFFRRIATRNAGEGPFAFAQAGPRQSNRAALLVNSLSV